MGWANWDSRICDYGPRHHAGRLLARRKRAITRLGTARHRIPPVDSGFCVLARHRAGDCELTSVSLHRRVRIPGLGDPGSGWIVVDAAACAARHDALVGRVGRACHRLEDAVHQLGDCHGTSHHRKHRGFPAPGHCSGVPPPWTWCSPRCCSRWRPGRQALNIGSGSCWG